MRSIGVLRQFTPSTLSLQIDLEIFGLERYAVRAESVVGLGRNQQIAQLRIMPQPLAHLVPHEIGHDRAHRLVEEHFRECREPHRERPVVPVLLQHLRALVGRQLGPGTVLEVIVEAREGGAHAGLELIEPRAPAIPVRLRVFRIPHGHDVLRRAHKNLHRPDFGRDGLDDLDAGSPGAHHGHALALEIDTLFRPKAGMGDHALERGLAREALVQRCRQHAAAGQQILRIDVFTVGGDHIPAAVLLAISRPIRSGC